VVGLKDDSRVDLFYVVIRKGNRGEGGRCEWLGS
jgi:hypothetical protein